MIEVEKDFASKGVAGAGLGLGIAGTALGLLNGGIPGLLGGWNGCNAAAACSENMAVNRYELNMQRELTNKDMEIAYLKGRDAAKSDSLELYRYVDGKFAAVERELADQRVFNATQIGTISCMQGQIAQLMGLTKTIVPIDNVCPQPMKLYNSWTAPTTTTGA
jgi:hypothetical protein